MTMASRPKYFERLLAFLKRKGRSREDAEDLIQEAMLRLHVYGQAEVVVNEEAFLRQAVHNLSIDQHRRDRPDLRRTVSIEDVNGRGLLVAPGLAPDQILEAQQQSCNVAAHAFGVPCAEVPAIEVRQCRPRIHCNHVYGRPHRSSFPTRWHVCDGTR